MSWDCLIVGAGSAGCALAYELVKSGQEVLVLEAGGSDRSPWLRIPAGTWRLAASDNGVHDWGYRSQPDPSRKGAAEAWHRGRVLGGTSSINGMIYVRGAAGDFDQWAQTCGQRGGWSASEIMPIYREFEHSDQLSPLRGEKGPLYIRTVSRPHDVTRAFVASACAAGHAFNPDYNGASQEGVTYLQFTQRRGLRCSSADAFLKPLQGRKNLKVLLNAMVEKIEVGNGRAVAVVFRHRGRCLRECARNIVLSAGVINSPQLLMLSGIGSAAELRRHNIDVVLDLPAVGNHLAEQAIMTLSYRSRVPTYNLTQGMRQKLAIAAQYLLFREGPVAAAYEAAAFLKASPLDSIPEFQVFFAPIGWEKAKGAYQLAPYPAFNIVILRSHTLSSGRIRLAGREPLTPPLIESRLLECDADIDTLAQGIETVRAIMRREPIANLIDEETRPGSAIADAKALREYIRSCAGTACHPIGTCRMGLGADTVVGPDLRVHGTENLWIADASIMPNPISANFNAVCMMIGAKLGKHLAARRFS
jgi:choline dehydrogenase